MDEKTCEELVEETMRNEEVLSEWGILEARRLSRILYVVFIVVTLATAIGAVAYLLLADSASVTVKTSGYLLVLLLACATFVLRFLQIRAQRTDIDRLAAELTRKLNGDPDHDLEVQTQVEAGFEWRSRTYMVAIRMVALAMVVLVAINTYQGAALDMPRQLVFDGCIASVVAGFAFNQFLLRAEMLEAELRARAEAAARYQSTPQFKAAQEALRARHDAIDCAVGASPESDGVAPISDALPEVDAEQEAPDELDS